MNAQVFNDQVRRPAVAGLFYPDNARELRHLVRQYLESAEPVGIRPKALIVPHAGFIYSGPVAASAYAQIAGYAAAIERVILLGPSHQVAFHGLALPETSVFETPMGRIRVDNEFAGKLQDLPFVQRLDAAHCREHSLEVQLPFLQYLLNEFSVVPLVIGEADERQIGTVLDRLWGGAETLIVISSDLSHYHGYEVAARLDARTAAAIVNLRGHLGPEDACGCRGINGLTHAARQHGLGVRALDLRNSGDTAGDKSRVVGYGAWALSA